MPGLTFTRKSKESSILSSWHAEVEDHVIGLAWSPDGDTLAAAAISGPITLFERETGLVKHLLPGHDFGTSAISWSPDGSVLASGGQDGKVRLWDVASGEARAVLDGGSSWVERVSWSPRMPLLASAAGKKLKLWNQSGELVRSYPDHPSTIADLAWKPGASEISTAHYGGLSILSPDHELPLVRHEWQGSTLVIAWSPDAKFIATGDQDSTVHFWIAKSGKDLQMWGYPMKVRELSWNFSSRYLATGGGNAVIVWDCSGKGPANTKPMMLDGHDAPLSCLAWQRSGSLLAAGDAAGRLVLWQPTRTKRPLALTDYLDEIAQLAWSPDDRRLAIGTGNGLIDVLIAP